MSNPDERMPHGPEIKDLLSALTDEIAASRRRHEEALAEITSRLAAMEAGAGATANGTSDISWDAGTAEAMTRAYEAHEAELLANHGASFGWGEPKAPPRLAEISRRMLRAISDMRPQSTRAAIGERLEQLQARIGATMADVARKSDVRALDMIEAHVRELAGRLDHLEAQLARLGGIEAQLKVLIGQLSDERLAKVLERDRRLAGDLETVARNAADAVQARYADLHETVSAQAAKLDALRALIEDTINDQRLRERHTDSAIADLGDTLAAQADHHDQLKALLETSLTERRHGEAQTMSVLDTVQLALIRILDRIEGVETDEHAAPGAAEAHGSHGLDEMPDRYDADDDEAESIIPAAARSFTRFEADLPTPRPRPQASGGIWDASVATMPIAHGGAGATAAAIQVLNTEPPRPYREPVLHHADAYDDAGAWEEWGEPVRPTPGFGPSDPPGAPLAAGGSLRRDLVVEAQRAKLKAASRRAYEDERAAEWVSPGSVLHRAEPGSSKLPGTGERPNTSALSPRVLAGALAVILAINGALLLLARGPGGLSALIPAVTGPSEPAMDADHVAPPWTGPVHVGKLPDFDASGLGGWPGDEAESAAGAPLTANQPEPPPYIEGFETGAPAVEAPEQGAAAEPPELPGIVVLQPPVPPVDEDLARAFEDQLMATLSGQVGQAAATATPAALMANAPARAETAATSGADPGGERRSMELDLPPASVGPLSLRLAAANGDPSAEFEVGARLAEGHGAAQDLGEALRWYQRSASRGFAQAQYRVGTIFERGLGRAPDVKRAAVWYRRAAEQGNIKAMHNLAVLSVDSALGAADYDTAAAWFTAAAERGLADSQYNLAVLYERGLGVAESPVDAYKWYSLAARGGDKDAVERREQVKAALSSADLARGDALVAAFRPMPADVLANDPRAAGEDWKRRQASESGT